jgi:uncharacterized protein YndB with AHSA1/START domain
MAETVSVVREIAASPERVWELISDLPRMGEWSNENEGGTWLNGATGPQVGAEFRGANRNGFRRWKTLATVTESEPGQRFGFDVTSLGLPISTWSYTIEPTESGCAVTESWTDRRPGFFKPIARLATGVADRTEHTRSGMEHTLERLAATAEATA